MLPDVHQATVRIKDAAFAETDNINDGQVPAENSVAPKAVRDELGKVKTDPAKSGSANVSVPFL